MSSAELKCDWQEISPGNFVCKNCRYQASEPKDQVCTGAIVTAQSLAPVKIKRKRKRCCR